jgi:hypothetical protein
MTKSTHEEKQIMPRNKLQRLAFLKGYRSSTSFAKAVVAAKIGVSYGTAFAKWHTNTIGNSEHPTVKAIANFLGTTIEEVFDP